jgi:hypothetical protein
VFIDGRTLPMDVYASSDINVVIAELQASVAELQAGAFRSYWEGTEAGRYVRTRAPSDATAAIPRARSKNAFRFSAEAGS